MSFRPPLLSIALAALFLTDGMSAQVSGATHGGHGLLNVNVAATDDLAFGLPLLIANDPCDLVDYQLFGLGALGQPGSSSGLRLQPFSGMAGL